MDDMVNEDLLRLQQDEDYEEILSLSSTKFELPLSSLKLSPPVCVSEETPLEMVLEIMQEKRIGSVLVVSEYFQLVGILTERDILFRVIGKIPRWETTPVSDVMTIDPMALQKRDMIAYAMNNMHVGGYRHVPIVDENNHPVAVISVRDVMGYILDNFPKHILNITGQPFRGIHQQESA